MSKEIDTPAGHPGKDATPKAPLVNEREKKKLLFITRTIWTFVMLAAFTLSLMSGHIPLVCLVSVCQVLIFKEIIALTLEPVRNKKLPFTQPLNWYFLIATVYFLDGELLFDHLKDGIFTIKALSIAYRNHRFICYSLYLSGFVFFVLLLKKGFYGFQFAQLCATHMVLVLVVFQSHFIIENIFSGIFWFLLPASLVIVNDIFAYLCGITFGKTQLLEISPKKTVEGFIGAWFCTGIAGVVLAFLLSQLDYMICPAVSLNTNVYNYPHCEPNPVFIPQLYQLPDNIASWVGRLTVQMKPLYVHTAVLATFASLIAPFGGFFASGLKRAFGIKDFGNTIPGHGGLTDRFDCQFLMGLFSYLYFQTFVASSSASLHKILQMAVYHLSITQIDQLVRSLLKYLHAYGALPQDKMNAIFELLATE